MFDTTAAQVDPVLAEVLADLAKLAAVDVTVAGDEELCDTAVVLEHARRYLDATQQHTLAELDARAVTDQAHGLRTGPWLAREAALPSTVANQQVRLAVKLRRVLPQVARALAEGRITTHHARVLADAANPRIEDRWGPVAALLCDAVEGVTFDQWRREVQGLAELLDQEGGHRPDDDTKASRVRLSDVGGTAVLTGELTGEDALIATDALNALADELFHQHQRDREHAPDLPLPTRAELLAEALVEACRRGLAIDLTATKAPRSEAALVLTPDQLDAHSHFHRALRDLGFSQAPDGNSLSAALHAPSEICSGTMTVTDAHGTLLRPDAYRCLLCDPTIHPVIVNDDGVPLKMGRQIRFATLAQRRALTVRDGGCTFPGCTTPPSWTDAHHIVHWNDLGETDITNLLSLCRHHHRVAHRRGWSLTLTDDGWTRWTPPTAIPSGDNATTANEPAPDKPARRSPRDAAVLPTPTRPHRPGVHPPPTRMNAGQWRALATRGRSRPSEAQQRKTQQPGKTSRPSSAAR